MKVSNSIAIHANDGPLKHSLEDLRDKRLGLHLVLNVLVIAKAGLNQVFEKRMHKLLRISLLTNFKLVRNLFNQDYH